jgi:hypothetical protein
MKKMVVLSVAFAAGILYATALYAGDAYYVQSAKAKVMSGKSFKSAVLGEASRGHLFASGERAGNWVKVMFNERHGYVYSLLVATHPPLEKARVIRADDREINKGVRRRTSSYTSAAAARGLAQDDRRRLSRDVKADYDSVEKIETFNLAPGELNRFMKGDSL